ncbi:MAG: phenylacetate--CoA ligase family protein, partial [Candidatus Binatia bacterium]
LANRLMPLVRYEIGDYAVARSTPCACGRGLPTIGKVAGRAVNLFRRPNGERFSPWTLVGPVRRVTEFRQFQLVQQALDHLVVRYVSDAEIGEDRLATARRELLERLGFPARIDFDRRASIARAASGKFMTALSAL